MSFPLIEFFYNLYFVIIIFTIHKFFSYQKFLKVEVRLESNETKKFDVIIEKQEKVDLSHIRSYITVGTDTAWNENIQEVLMALNAFTNSEIKLNYLTLGPKVFFPPPENESS